MIVSKYDGLAVDSIDSYLQIRPTVSQASLGKLGASNGWRNEEATKGGDNEASNATAIKYKKTQIYYFLKWHSKKHSVRRVDKSKSDGLMQ